MKLENVLKLEELCQHHNDSYCFTKDHDSLEGLTCQHCTYGNELVEQLLEKMDNFREARDLYFTHMTELLEALKNCIKTLTYEGIGQYDYMEGSDIYIDFRSAVDIAEQAIKKAEEV